MVKMFDAVGHIYGRLTVIASLGVRKRKQFVLTRCECGNTFESALSNIRSGNTLSCGCLRKETTSIRATKHGYRNTRLYRVYTAMLQRCNNPNDRSFCNYGGRGITICAEWQESIHTFLAWAKSAQYSDDLELDRINVNEGYSPKNCRWVTQTVQARNRRTQKHSSKYTGVHYQKKTGKWVSAVTVNKVRSVLGSFDTEETAWKARCAFIDLHQLHHFQTNRNTE